MGYHWLKWQVGWRCTDPFGIRVLRWSVQTEWPSYAVSQLDEWPQTAEHPVYGKLRYCRRIGWRKYSEFCNLLLFSLV